MFKKIIHFFLMSIFLLVGCSDQRPVEDLSFPLVIGLDIDDYKNLHVYMSNPVFTKKTIQKEEIQQVKSFTVRNSPEKFDRQFMGMITGSKIQVILIGEKLLQQKNWVKYLDTFYRDPNNNMTARIIAVAGPVANIFQYTAKHKSGFSLYLTKLLNTAHTRNTLVSATLHDLYNQVSEKGITPSLGQIQQKDVLQVNGSVLLDHTSKKIMSITPIETKLLHILQNKKKGHFLFTLPLLHQTTTDFANHISFYIQDMKVHTNVVYNEKFNFYTNITMNIIITEFSPQSSRPKSISFLEKKIEREMTSRFQLFTEEIQKHQIDPIGYGLYARAYAYPEWKKSCHNWGMVYAQATTQINVKVKILGIGNIE
ncbi:MAG: Ger(x)C family spore germination protein [Bacillus sp. (in: firmicutes)]|uniref:Ger(x)C family spore germination protein n=1 Tax=Bacillus sp. TaxID=1409 RepID=UPI0039E26E6C